MTIVTKPNTFVANELIDANQMNQNFDSIYGLVNGNLDASNISVSGLNDLTKFANEVVTQLKTKGLIYTQDLFSQSFFVSGGLATFPGSPLNQISVTTATAYIIQADGSYRRVILTGTTYTTASISTTYYLDLQPDGTISWGTAHSGQTGYLSLATVTTNGSGNVNVVTDVRVLFAGMSWQNISKVGSSLADIAIRLASDLVLTGYVSGAGTVAATDSILAAIQKLNGNDALKLLITTAASTYAPLSNPSFSSNVTVAGEVFVNSSANASINAMGFGNPTGASSYTGVGSTTSTVQGIAGNILSISLNAVAFLMHLDASGNLGLAGGIKTSGTIQENGSRVVSKSASVSEVLVTSTSLQVVATYTPTVQGNFFVGIYIRVITGTTTVTVTITYTDSTGAKTITVVTTSLVVGSYNYMQYVNATAAAINVNVTASVANQVRASASIIAS